MAQYAGCREVFRHGPEEGGRLNADLEKAVSNAFDKSLPAKLRGIYFLFDAGRLVYVGQSVDIIERVYKHKRDKSFDRFSYTLMSKKEVPTKFMVEMEAMLIQYFAPKYNIANNIKAAAIKRKAKQAQQ